MIAVFINNEHGAPEKMEDLVLKQVLGYSSRNVVFYPSREEMISELQKGELYLQGDDEDRLTFVEDGKFFEVTRDTVFSVKPL